MHRGSLSYIGCGEGARVAFAPTKHTCTDSDLKLKRNILRLRVRGRGGLMSTTIADVPRQDSQWVQQATHNAAVRQQWMGILAATGADDVDYNMLDPMGPDSVSCMLFACLGNQTSGPVSFARVCARLPADTQTVLWQKVFVFWHCELYQICYLRTGE